MYHLLEMYKALEPINLIKELQIQVVVRIQALEPINLMKELKQYETNPSLV